LSIIAGLALASFSAALIARMRRVAVDLGLLARVLAPLAIGFALPPLFVRELWVDAEIELLIYAGVVGLLLERSLGIAFAALATMPPPAIPVGERVKSAARWTAAHLPALVLALAIAGYWLVISHGTVVSHHRIATASSDLAEFDNLFFNALHGHPFRAPAIAGDLTDWTALRVHAEFVLYLLLPLYALAPGPEQLLRIQTAVIALTAVPIYLFAARRLGRHAGCAIALAYLLLPAVQRPNFYDFHFTPVGMFFVAWTLYCYDRALEAPGTSRAQRAALVACFALALLSREDTAATLAIAFFLLGAAGVGRTVSFALAGAALLYVVAVKFVLMPRFGMMWFDQIYERLKAPGDAGLAAVFATIASNPMFVVRTLMSPARFLYLLHMTAPLLFLWNRRWYLWLAALPAALFTLMVTDRPPMNDVSFQYTYLWVPYIVLASVLGLGALAASDPLGWPRKSAATVALLVVALGCSWNQGALLGNRSIIGGFGEKRLSMSADERARLAELEQLIARIPDSASVAATEHEGPHVSTRLVVYSLKLSLGHAPDYILVGPQPFRIEVRHMAPSLRAGDYGLVAEAGAFALFQRGADPSQNRRLLKRWRAKR
jgi:uncharacterized membrane protein